VSDVIGIIDKIFFNKWNYN